MSLNISTKEMLALVNALQVAPISIRDCRVDVAVDSQVAIDTFQGQGSRTSSELTMAAKDLFYVLADWNIQLTLSHVSLIHNPADAPSRNISHLDSTLSPRVWSLVYPVPESRLGRRQFVLSEYPGLW